MSEDKTSGEFGCKLITKLGLFLSFLTACLITSILYTLSFESSLGLLMHFTPQYLEYFKTFSFSDETYICLM